jgi:hypothetical protein
MIETITPAVCGSRRRQRIAIGIFALAAVAAAALVGAALGLAGAALGAREAILAAAALATLAAARELGLLRLPLPQARGQVPDRWRSELALPVWAAGYGAGLGAGFLTYQPVATFWVACAAALALEEPLPAAACFALYGLGRAVMVALPASLATAPPLAVERLARRRRLLARTNGGVLAAAAVALALAPAASADPLFLGSGSQLDPTLSGGVLAYTQRDVATGVIVRVSETETFDFPGARGPSLDESFLAYEDEAGVRVVRWRSGAQVARIEGATRPALDWPWLAYRIDAFDGAKELWLRNLTTGSTLLLTKGGARSDIGRPSVAAGRVAWHLAGERGSSIFVYEIENGARRPVARSRIALLSHPSLTDSRITWVDQRMGSSYLRLRRLAGGPLVTLAVSRDRAEEFWTTALAGRAAYVTRWFVGFDLAEIERFRF